ncbi:MAG: ATP-binding protein [Bacteroidia bacterium]|nr:ATP-binding protein [Bacteroidia bacterium]
MEQSNSFERKIGVKIGLLFLIIILYVVGIFIYSHNLKKNIDTQKEEISASHAVLSQSNRLIISVQEAQDALNAYLVTPQKTLQQKYDSISSDISRQITEIKQLASQSSQDIYLESVDSLLQEKNKIVNQLIVQFRSQSPLRELDKKIETYPEFIQDSVVVTTNKDTTVVVKDKKGLWARLRNLVNPSRAPDTIISVAQVQQETRLTSRIDTGMYADLKNITQAASKTYSSQISGIEKQVRGLILAEQSISLQISQLLTKFYNETTRLTGRGIRNSELLTRRIFTFAVLVGALSLVVILVIILFIDGDLKQGQKARSDLAKEKQLTESLMDSRHKLLLSVSHDIKTPLSSMMGYMEMWESENISEDKKRQLRSAHNSGTHILSMLTNLLEFSRLERNTGELHTGRFNVVELMEEIIRMFEPLTEEKKLDIAFENLASSPFFIETDYTALKQILINIVSNAVKYTIRGRIDMTLRYAGNLVFTIKDTGIGMAESDIREIYKPFSRIKNPLKAAGNGFGMYVTKGLIHALKGEIEIQSEKNKGTTVVITLPLHPTEEAPDKGAIHARNRNNTYDKVLVFEDDISLGNMIKEFLLQNGYKVKVCNHSRDVNGFIQHLSLFDIVFTDMQMLHITGSDILKEIRNNNAHIPVWLMTANDDYTTEKAISEGFSGFIKKPIQMSKFIEILSGENGFKAKEPSSYGDKFPALIEMFGDDTETINDILTGFIHASRKDTAALREAVNNNNFVEAQRICHRIHPFLSQIGADNLCGVLHKMDSLRGQDETAYPAWKEDLWVNIQQINELADGIEKSI